MTTISDILETIRGYSADANLKPVMSAYLLAARAHAGQKRKSGEPYLSHPLAVTKILADMKMDTDTLATALLHDALEDNPITKEEMQEQIGLEITELVDGVTKIGKLKFRSHEELAAENFRKMMLAMSRDLRVILVKLADRLHNMQTLEHHKPEKQKKISRETLDIFVPIANRLGLIRIKSDLEDLCFRYSEPEAYVEIDTYLQETQADREQYTLRIIKALELKLNTEAVQCDIKGRAKHRYSIYKKMCRQGLKVDEVPDLLAFRILVEDVAQCYAVLGFIHAHFPPVPSRIKDYIARPKANGYQSLHTTVMGPADRRIEVQIRTRMMDQIAEEGIAAHWRYKEGKLALSPEDVARISKIRDLFESAHEASNATDFMETLKVEFYADEVFVFTPRGDIKQFRAGSTALDFAYAVHSDVGNSCIGAKVNGRMVPIRYELQSGDSLEILTSSTQVPSRDWLEIAKTGRAIQKIRRYLREEERELGIRLGREMLEGELRKFHFTLAKAKTDGRLKEFLSSRSPDDLDELFVEVARGQLSLGNTVRDILPTGLWESKREQNTGTLANLLNRFRSRVESPVLITGEDGVLVNFANCCAPLPGEPVGGFVTRGRGITVHQAACTQFLKMDLERQISVQWDPERTGRHTGEIQVYCTNKPGLLASISKVCEKAQVNINRAEAHGLPDGRAMCLLEVAVRNVDEMTRLMKNLEKVAGVESVERPARH